MRALGLEPSLVRGKSPVPYQSGVTRVVGRQGIEPRMSVDGWVTTSVRAMRDRPMCDRCGDRPQRLRCLCSCQGAVGRTGCAARCRPGRCRTLGSRCWKPRRHHWLEPMEDDAHDVVRVLQVADDDQTMSVGATSTYRGCDCSQLPDSPASIPCGVAARGGTRTRRSSTRMTLGVSVRRCVRVP